MAKKDDDDTVWYLQTGFLASAGFLMLLLVVGLVLVVTGPKPAAAAGAPSAPAPATSDVTPTVTPTSQTAPSESVVAVTRDTAAAPSPSPAATSAGGAASAVSVCGLAAGSQVIPTTPPAASWTFVGSIAAPVSARFGPATEVGGIGNCYAHSPTGALFALFNTLALTEVSSDQISAAAVVRQRGSRSGDYATALAEAEQQDARIMLPADTSTTQKVAVLGYRYIDYTADRAAIAVAVGIGDPSRQATYLPSLITASVAWEDGDWKFVYSAATAATTAPIISTEQFTPWAA